jgi:hypothetical protein
MFQNHQSYALLIWFRELHALVTHCQSPPRVVLLEALFVVQYHILCLFHRLTCYVYVCYSNLFVTSYVVLLLRSGLTGLHCQ